MASAETHYTLPLPVFDKPVKLLIVVAPYYRDIADNLIAGARAVAAGLRGRGRSGRGAGRAGGADRHRDGRAAGEV